jgi:hypothetical protein
MIVTWRFQEVKPIDGALKNKDPKPVMNRAVTLGGCRRFGLIAPRPAA